MTPLIPANTPEQNQFVSISDFNGVWTKAVKSTLFGMGKNTGSAIPGDESLPTCGGSLILHSTSQQLTMS